MTRAHASVLVALVAAAVLSLRLFGIGAELPHSAHADERVWIRQLELLRDGHDVRADPLACMYPTLIARAVDLRPRDTRPVASVDEHLARASEPIRALRALAAALSVLVVPATYRIARQFLPRAASLLAAALAGASLLTQFFAQQARPHAAASALAACAVAASLELARRPSTAKVAIAGVFAALAIGVLPSAAAVLPALGVAFIVSRRTARAPSYASLFLVVAPLVASIALFYGSATIVKEPPEGAGEPARLLGHRLYVESFDGRGFAVLLAKSWEFEPLLLVLAIAGCARAIAEWKRTSFDRRTLAVAGAHAVPYGLLIGAYGESYERFLLPLGPYVAVLASFAVLGAGSRVGSGAPSRTRLGIAVVVLVLEALGSARLAALRASPDTLVHATRWVREHLDRERDRVEQSRFIDLPLARDARSLERVGPMVSSWAHPWLRYQHALDRSENDRIGWDVDIAPVETEEGRESARADPVAFFESHDAGTWIFALESADRPLFWTLRDVVRQRSDLVATFRASSGAEPAFVPPREAERDVMRFVPLPYHLWRKRALGPDVEIYQPRR